MSAATRAPPIVRVPSALRRATRSVSIPVAAIASRSVMVMVGKYVGGRIRAVSPGYFAPSNGRGSSPT